MRYPEMKTTEELSAKWLCVVRKAFAESDGSGKKVGEVLGETFGAGLDEKLVGQARCEGCGGTAESQGRRSRNWGSILGQLRLKPRYAFCDDCKQGIAPAQKALGLSDSNFTPRLEEVTTMMAATVPFGMAKTLVGKLCGIDASIKGIEEMVERRAEAVQRLDAEEAVRCAPYDAKGLPVESQRRPADTVPESEAPKVAYLRAPGWRALLGAIRMEA